SHDRHRVHRRTASLGLSGRASRASLRAAVLDGACQAPGRRREGLRPMSVVPESARPSRLAALRTALETGAMRHAQRMVNSLHPAEVASLLEALPPAKREIVWEFIDPELEGDVLLELHEDVRNQLISGMDADELIAATEGMEVDDLADLIGDL